MSKLSQFFLLLLTSAVIPTIAQQQGSSPTTTKHVGNLFLFTPGLGACGFNNTSSDIVASVSQRVFQTFPGATDNPNRNPICKYSVVIASDQQNILRAPIVDSFMENKTDNIGLSLAGFSIFASKDQGVVRNVTWNIVSN